MIKPVHIKPDYIKPGHIKPVHINPVHNKPAHIKALRIGHSNQRGFTLVEVIVVMVIIALVMGLVATSLSRSVSSAEARAATRKLVANLRYTRTKAIVDKQEKTFSVDVENRSYTAPGRKQVTLPKGVELTLTTARSEMTAENVGGIRFFPDGGSTGGHIEMYVNGREYRVNVAWLTGEASLQRVEG